MRSSTCMDQLRHVLARLNSQGGTPPFTPGLEELFGPGPTRLRGSNGLVLSGVEFPADETSLEQLDIVQMGKDTIQLSRKLHNLSKEMLAPHLISVDVRPPKNYTLTPEEALLYKKNFEEICSNHRCKNVTAYEMSLITIGLEQALVDQAGRPSTKTPTTTSRRRRDIYRVIWNLIEIKILSVQSHWVLFVELQRRHQIARQELELVQLQATGVDWRYKILRTTMDFCNQYPNFQILFTNKLSYIGLHWLIADYTDLLPIVERNFEEQLVDLRIQK